jgi:hypothetical protein
VESTVVRKSGLVVGKKSVKEKECGREGREGKGGRETEQEN